jgi:hypothetical protein
MTARWDVRCDGVLIGTYRDPEDARAHAHKHGRATHGKAIEGWRVTSSGETGTIPGDPPVEYEISENSSAA